jgi:class 3 adenylate cyclase
VNESANVLVVDDTPQNVKLLTDLLMLNGYRVESAQSGEEALAKIAASIPDIVLLDVMMPGLSGYDVCRKIRQTPATALLPVVMVTSLDPQTERVNGIEAGADDFLAKPINRPELFARVKSLLRVKSLQDEVKRQAEQLAEWNSRLEARVAEQVTQIERMGRLKGFFSPQIAELIVSGGAEDLLRPHRREITVIFLDLRGFTSFTETAEPEEVMDMLSQYHAAVGRLVADYEGTIEHFAGDGMMIFFNDPVTLENSAASAARMSLTLQADFAPLRAGWRKRGYTLDLGIGLAQGYATLGAIGFAGRQDYAAIGSVTNLATRLCAEAKGGETLTNQKTFARIDSEFDAEELGARTLRGFAQPVNVFRIVSSRTRG